MSRLDILLFISLAAGLSCLGTTGYLLTNTDSTYKGSWAFGGLSSMVFLFVTSCIASTVGLIMLGTRDEIHKTRFFVTFNGTMAIFYVAGGIACIIIASDKYKNSNTQTAIAGSVLGFVASLIHGLMSFLSRG